MSDVRFCETCGVRRAWEWALCCQQCIDAAEPEGGAFAYTPDDDDVPDLASCAHCRRSGVALQAGCVRMADHAGECVVAGKALDCGEWQMQREIADLRERLARVERERGEAVAVLEKHTALHWAGMSKNAELHERAAVVNESLQASLEGLVEHRAIVEQERDAAIARAEKAEREADLWRRAAADEEERSSRMHRRAQKNESAAAGHEAYRAGTTKAIAHLEAALQRRAGKWQSYAREIREALFAAHVETRGRVAIRNYPILMIEELRERAEKAEGKVLPDDVPRARQVPRLPERALSRKRDAMNCSKCNRPSWISGYGYACQASECAGPGPDCDREARIVALERRAHALETDLHRARFGNEGLP